MDRRKAERTRIVLRLWTQVRVVTPYSDFKVYQEARRYNLPYRDTMLRNGRRFMKKTRRT